MKLIVTLTDEVTAVLAEFQARTARSHMQDYNHLVYNIGMQAPSIERIKKRGAQVINWRQIEQY